MISGSGSSTPATTLPPGPAGPPRPRNNTRQLLLIVVVAIIAFGFKYGVPLDCDLMFDVRFLPNPNYVPVLKPLTGNDAPVAAFLEVLPQTEEFLGHLLPMVDFLLPQFRHEGKSQLTIGIGCTGGRHRSVYLARRLEKHLLAANEAAVTVEERDSGR